MMMSFRYYINSTHTRAVRVCVEAFGNCLFRSGGRSSLCHFITHGAMSLRRKSKKDTEEPEAVDQGTYPTYPFFLPGAPIAEQPLRQPLRSAAAPKKRMKKFAAAAGDDEHLGGGGNGVEGIGSGIGMGTSTGMGGMNMNMGMVVGEEQNNEVGDEDTGKPKRKRASPGPRGPCDASCEPTCRKRHKLPAQDYCGEVEGKKLSECCGWSEGCERKARGSTGLCFKHGGGRKCALSGCEKSARGKTLFCSLHGGGSRCQEVGCNRSAQGTTDKCSAHGGGKRCQFEDCCRGARGASAYCSMHGGGKRCEEPGCDKGARGKTGLCAQHQKRLGAVDFANDDCL